MLSTSEIIFEYICPGCGMIIANIMFTAPFRDAMHASKNGTLGTLNPLPWAFMLGNCTGWVLYSVLIGNGNGDDDGTGVNYFVFFGNAPGLLLSIYFNIIAIRLQYYEERCSRHDSTTTSTIMMLPPLQQNNNNNNVDIERLEQQQQQVKKKNEESSLVGDEHHGDGGGGGGDMDMDADADGAVVEKKNEKVQRIDHNNIVRSSANFTVPSSDDLLVVADDDDAQQQQQGKPQNESSSPYYYTASLSLHESTVMFMVILWLSVMSIIGFASETLSNDGKQLLVGIIVNMNLLVFYAAPLSTIISVIRTNTSESIHIPTMITNTANGTFWCLYGIAVFDYFIAIPNGVGAALGIVQFILCILYPRRK